MFFLYKLLLLFVFFPFLSRLFKETIYSPLSPNSIRHERGRKQSNVKRECGGCGRLFVFPLFIFIFNQAECSSVCGCCYSIYWPVDSIPCMTVTAMVSSSSPLVSLSHCLTQTWLHLMRAQFFLFCFGLFFLLLPLRSSSFFLFLFALCFWMPWEYEFENQFLTK